MISSFPFPHISLILNFRYFYFRLPDGLEIFFIAILICILPITSKMKQFLNVYIGHLFLLF